ncbi:MAG: serine/threonine-protein kinase [Cyanobacteriota/Melainabacteria group bacterium]
MQSHLNRNDNESEAQNASTNSGITERFEIAKVLSSGKTSMAYKAVDKILGQEVTVKTIAPDLVNKERLPEFHRDLKVVSAIDHDCIARVLDYGQTRSSKPYMVLEYIDAPSLKEHLKKNGPLAPDLAVSIAVQLLEALIPVHSAGIIHRDIKPSNIFLASAGDGGNKNDQGPIPVLIDFGFGHIRQPNERGIVRSTSGNFAGSPAYMAPEQIVGEVEGPYTDVYALGCVLYEMLSGSPPFSAPSDEELLAMHLESLPPPLPALKGKPDQWSEQIEAIIKLMLEKEGSARPGDVGELASALAALLPQKKKSGKEKAAKKEKQNKQKAFADSTNNGDPQALPRTESFSLLQLIFTTILFSLIFLVVTTVLNHPHSHRRQITDKPLTIQAPSASEPDSSSNRQ